MLEETGTADSEAAMDAGKATVDAGVAVGEAVMDAGSKAGSMAMDASAAAGKATMDAGTAVIYSYTTQHRGLASSRPDFYRPVLKLDYFADTCAIS